MKTPHRDFRSLDEAAQAEVRRQAFRSLDNGMKRKNVALLADVHYKTIDDWISRRKEFEKREYRGKKRGGILNEQKLLTTAEEMRIKTIIETKTPDKAGLSYALRNRKAIKELVKKKTKKTMALETASKYAKRWGFAPQRPAKYAIEQNAEAVQKWLKGDYPKIAKKARKEGAEIHREDEAGVSLSAFYARSCAPIGKTPAIRLPVRHASLSMISSIANRGDLRFMIYRGALNADRFIVFLKRLAKDADKKIFLIADNLRVHKAKKVTAWVKEREDAIALFSLPPYAPQCNPDELLNNALKQNAHVEKIPRNPDELRANMFSFLCSVQKRPALVRSFFEASKTKYARMEGICGLG